MKEDRLSINTARFMSLLVPNQKEIYAFVRYLVPCRADADDILQETLAEMWNKFDDYQDGTNFVAWGITVAKYKVLTFIRKKKTFSAHLDEKTIQVLHNHATSSHLHDTFTDRMEVLKKCISKLSQKQGKYLSLRYEQDLTFEGIAKQFGLSIPAIYKTLSLIQANLAKCVRRTLHERDIL